MKHLHLICACIQMWKRKDCAKPPSLSLKRRKQSTEVRISVREIARCEGLTKEVKYNSVDEISCRKNCYCSTQGIHILIGISSLRLIDSF